MGKEWKEKEKLTAAQNKKIIRRKNKVKKTRNILVSLLACLFVILAVPAAVSAAAKAPQCPKKQTLEFYRAHTSYGEVPADGDGYIYIKNLSRSAVITNVRSSNKYYTASKAAGLNAVYVTTSDYNSIHDVEDGEKTKLRFTVKQNGKSYNLSCAVTFKKHSRVFKSVKIGSKNYAALAKGHWTVRDKGTAPKSKVKITVKTVKNYKVDSIEICYKNNKPKKIKNGGKVSLKNVASIYINYHMTAKPKYYKKPTAGYRGFFFGGTVKSPLYESFYIDYIN